MPIELATSVHSLVNAPGDWRPPSMFGKHQIIISQLAEAEL